MVECWYLSSFLVRILCACVRVFIATQKSNVHPKQQLRHLRPNLQITYIERHRNVVEVGSQKPNHVKLLKTFSIVFIVFADDDNNNAAWWHTHTLIVTYFMSHQKEASHILFSVRRPYTHSRSNK